MMCVGTHEGSGLPSHSRARGGSHGHNLGTFAGLIGKKRAGLRKAGLVEELCVHNLLLYLF